MASRIDLLEYWQHIGKMLRMLRHENAYLLVGVHQARVVRAFPNAAMFTEWSGGKIIGRLLLRLRCVDYCGEFGGETIFKMNPTGRSLVALHDNEMDRLRRGIQQLREENDSLRAAICAPTEDGDPEANFAPDYFTKTQARIYTHLFRNYRRIVTKDSIEAVLPTASAQDRDLKVVDVHICKIRKLMEQHNSDHYIETVWGQGVRMVPRTDARVHSRSDRKVAAQ